MPERPVINWDSANKQRMDEVENILKPSPTTAEEDITP
jgi:hypothetical protein